MEEYTIEDGEELIKAARNTIELLTKSTSFKSDIVKDSLDKKKFKEKRGVFLSLKHYHTGKTRGEMAFLFPELELKSGVVDSAVGAASKDLKFIPLSGKELDNTIIELSIISNPEILKGGEKKRIAAIKKGRDGIIIEYGVYKGFILPWTIEDNGWTKQRAFEELCLLARIPKTYWMQPNVKVYRFEAQTFKEETPNGKVVMRETIKITKDQH